MRKSYKKNTVFKTEEGSKRPYGYKNPLGGMQYYDTYEDALHAQSVWKPKFRDLVKFGIIPIGTQIGSAGMIWQILGLSIFSVKAKLLRAPNSNSIGVQFDSLLDMAIAVYGKQKATTAPSAKVALGKGPVQRLDEIQKGFYEKLVQQHPPQDKTVQSAQQVVLPLEVVQELEVVVEDEFSPAGTVAALWEALLPSPLSEAGKCATVAFVFDKISECLEQDSGSSTKEALTSSSILDIV